MLQGIANVGTVLLEQDNIWLIESQLPARYQNHLRDLDQKLQRNGKLVNDLFEQTGSFQEHTLQLFTVQ